MNRVAIQERITVICLRVFGHLNGSAYFFRFGWGGGGPPADSGAGERNGSGVSKVR